MKTALKQQLSKHGDSSQGQSYVHDNSMVFSVLFIHSLTYDTITDWMQKQNPVTATKEAELSSAKPDTKETGKFQMTLILAGKF